MGYSWVSWTMIDIFKVGEGIISNYSSLLMQFAQWNVMIDIGFWTRLAKKKIEEYRLNASAQPLIAKYRLSNRPEKISILSVDAFSFEDATEDQQGPVDFKVRGTFFNTNTVEEFRAIDPPAKERELLAKQEQNFERYANGEPLSHLFEIHLLVFADLKKHLFNYQFYSTASPVRNYHLRSWTKAEEFFATRVPQKQQLDRIVKALSIEKSFPHLTVLKNFELSSITEFLSAPEGDYLFMVADTTNLPNATGYHTSTIFAFFAWLRKAGRVEAKYLQNVKFLLLKEFLMHKVERESSFSNSAIIEVNLAEAEEGDFESRLRHKKDVQDLDLKSFMDERTLAKEAVDLNIKLMKWRLLPTLDIPKIQAAKCLLFGAGTLGCQLARNLIGWGVKNISFIDYSKVSYSNPVRQTLYEYEDTIRGGRPKAETAAEKLRKIYPEINSKGYTLQVPMPGHYVTREEHIAETFRNLDLIEKLVQEHDVLFLLLDSRQARWLPTVLANKYDKACITVGLGFDSFVIVRHGVPPYLYKPEIHGERLCCYFCNDIVTPQNTMKDRTLDQMCTVTKPGLSFVSSAYAAELYVSLLHHPLQHHAPADEDSAKLPTTDLGKLPHHLRGNMGDFETSIFYGKAFEQCVACSSFVLEAYNKNREEFMLQVLNDPSFIHQVTGLQEELDSYANMEGGIIEINDDFDYFEDLPKEAEKPKEAKEETAKVEAPAAEVAKVETEESGTESQARKVESSVSQ